MTARKTAVAKTATKAAEKPAGATPAGALTEAALKKMPLSQYMNEQQLEFFRAQLLQMQQQILDNASNTSEHLREHEAEADIADQATIE